MEAIDMYSFIYNELKSWQSAIGTVCGFIALMSVALWNYRLSRRRDLALQEKESLSVAAALYGEILLLRIEVAQLANAVAHTYERAGLGHNLLVKIDKHFLEAHVLSEPTLYKALSSKLGMLDPGLILAITSFHSSLQQVRVFLPLLEDKKGRSYTYGPEYVLLPARDAVKEIVPALRKMEAMLGISTPAKEPNLDVTERVIEFEEEKLEMLSSAS